MTSSRPPQLPGSQRPAPIRAMRVAIALAGGYVLGGGLATLLGWTMEIPRLTDWYGTGITMKPNAALCAAAAGLALLLARQGPKNRLIVRILSLFVMATGGLTLLEHISGLDLGIDKLLFEEAPGSPATAAPGRMGPPACSSFVLIGTAMLLSTAGARARRWAAVPGLVVVLIASLSLLGYLYGASQLYTIPRLTAISLQMATMLTALGVGLVLLVPEHGLAAAMLRADSGGIALRRLLLPIVLVPVVVGLLRLQGQEAGLYDTAFGAAAVSLVMALTLALLLCWTADAMSRSSKAVKAAHQLLGDRAAHLESLVEERTEELRDIIGELEAFSYSMAHDLRGPLRALQGYANILKADYGGLLDETGHGYLTRIGAAAERMHRLVSDVLQYSAVSLESLPLSSVALPPLIQDIIEQYPALHTAEIRVAENMPPVLGNSAALTQVLANLLTNAAKFVALGKSAKVSIRARTEGEWIIVTVEDDGIGIAPKDHERVFRMFERVHGETEYEGTGIGLAIARRAAERMRGTLDVDSTAGEGSRFFLRMRSPV